MSDPFLPHNANSQFVREAKIGFSMVLLVVTTVGFWGYSQYRKFQTQIPQHVLNAPVAMHVGPDQYLSHLSREEAANARRFASHSTNAGRPARDARTQNSDHSQQNRLQQERIRPEIAVSFEQPVPQSDEHNQPVERSPSKAAKQPAVKKFSDNIASLTDFAKSFGKSEEDKINKASDSNPSRVFESRNEHSPPTAHDISSFAPRLQSESAADSNQQAKPAEVVAPVRISNAFVPQKPMAVRADEGTTSSPDAQRLQTNSLRSEQPAIHQLDETKQSEPSVEHEEFETTEDLNLEVIEPPAQVTSNPTPAALSDWLDKAKQIVGVYQSKTGDSFWAIAEKNYGDGRYFRALYEHNRSSVAGFDELPANSQIKTPSLDFLKKNYASHCPQDLVESADFEQMYTTVEGDTLFDIARQITGQASQYLELLKLNRDRLPIGANHLTRLPADLRLNLPGG